jgi:hypothetical protein
MGRETILLDPDIMVSNEKADKILAIVPRPVWVGKLIEVRVSGAGSLLGFPILTTTKPA